jgi:dCTP deaminase
MLEGRSSVGRLGLYIHVTAGFGDVGFEGFWTLELQCVQPIKIYADTEICQIYYHTILGEYEKYNSGKYQNNNGVQPSLMFKDFQKKCSKCICCDTEEMWCEQDNSNTYEDYAKQCKCYEEEL